MGSGWYRWVGEDLELTLKVQPRSSRDAFGEIEGDHRRVRIKAPPVDGRANQALRRFIADVLGVSQSSVELLSGEGSRSKRFRIHAPRRLPDGIERP